MKINENGKIVQASENELYDLWLRQWSDVIDFNEYKRRMVNTGVDIKENNEKTIKVIIEIPEDQYNWILKSDETWCANLVSKECMMYAIKNGISFSKYKKIIEEIKQWINSSNRNNADYFIIDKIEEIINKYESEETSND